MNETELLSGRARSAIVGLWVVAVADASAVVTEIFYARYLHSLPPQAIVDELELVTSEVLYSLTALAQLAAMVLAAIVFIRWFKRAHENLGVLSERTPTYHSRWTVWGFFVPVLNLIRPQQLMREIWETTSQKWREEVGRVVGLEHPEDVVNRWWGFFLATSFASNVAGRLTWNAATAQESFYATLLNVVVDAFDIWAVVVAVGLVRNVTALQRPLLGYAPASSTGGP